MCLTDSAGNTKVICHIMTEYLAGFIMGAISIFELMDCIRTHSFEKVEVRIIQDANN